MEHIKSIRFHTRVPIVSPETIPLEKISAVSGKTPVYVVIHANHAQEFTPEGIEACQRLVDAGFPLLCESVLLKGVNDTIEALEGLVRICVENRIKPYYLHHLDHAPGTEHFRVSIERGQELMRQLLHRCSGLCQPTYVLDIPGGVAKVPLTACKLEKLQKGNYRIEDPTGETHDYIDTAA